ncbi:hypothetical protein BGZ96_005142, partial [Linnemannia gamsii]
DLLGRGGGLCCRGQDYSVEQVGSRWSGFGDWVQGEPTASLGIGPIHKSKRSSVPDSEVLGSRNRSIGGIGYPPWSGTWTERGRVQTVGAERSYCCICRI